MTDPSKNIARSPTSSATQRHPVPLLSHRVAKLDLHVRTRRANLLSKIKSGRMSRSRGAVEADAVIKSHSLFLVAMDARPAPHPAASATPTARTCVRYSKLFWSSFCYPAQPSGPAVARAPVIHLRILFARSQSRRSSGTEIDETRELRAVGRHPYFRRRHFSWD